MAVLPESRSLEEGSFRTVGQTSEKEVTAGWSLNFRNSGERMK